MIPAPCGLSMSLRTASRLFLTVRKRTPISCLSICPNGASELAFDLACKRGPRSQPIRNSFPLPSRNLADRDCHRSNVPGHTLKQTMDSIQTQFDQAYLAAQPPEIQALMALDASSSDALAARATQGATLAGKGFLIDAPIMVYAWDAYLCMMERQSLGMTWAPSALMPGLGS